MKHIKNFKKQVENNDNIKSIKNLIEELDEEFNYEPVVGIVLKIY